MKAIDFYRFVHENEIEFHWAGNDETGERDVILFPSFSEMAELCKIMAPSHFDDGGIPCRMKYRYIAIWASDLLSRYGIDVVNVFGEEKDQ